MSERVKAGLHAAYHFWKGFRTYIVSDSSGEDWVGGECDCGATFGTAREWREFLNSLNEADTERSTIKRSKP